MDFGYFYRKPREIMKLDVKFLHLDFITRMFLLKGILDIGFAYVVSSRCTKLNEANT